MVNKKKLASTLGAVALIGAIGVGSTFAFLTSSTNTVTNTFTVGNVNFNEDMEGGIMESDVARDDETGDYEDADGAEKWTKTENTYEDLVAGETVYKDPTVFMAENSVDAYLFVRVYNTTDAAFANVNIDSAKWAQVGTGSDNAGSYIDYAYTSLAEADQNYTIFTEVTMADLVDGQQIPQILVKASAVQASGFANAEAAYAESVWK